MKIKLINIIGHIYFFFNVLGLPAPITFTNFISLLYIDKIFRVKNAIFYGIYIAISLIYLIIHFNNGVHEPYYLKTFFYNHLLFISTLISYYYVKKNKLSFARLFELIAKSSLILFAINIGLYFTDFQSIVWQVHDFNAEMLSIPRYKGFTYEASFYATVMSPVIIYFFLQFIFYKKKKSLRYLIFSVIPFVFTLSLGVYLALFIALILGIIFLMGFYLKIKQIFFVAFMGVLLVAVTVNVTDNVISQRITSILKGEDGSVKGRTVEAFYLSNIMAKEKSLLFGIGPGQIKVNGEKTIREYYNYPPWYTRVSIPNASAETYAVFGVIGFILRLLFELFLFFYFKVYKNYFSLMLFIFIFVYQFTGSFITSTAEYMIWIFAIVHLFPDFNIKNNDNFFKLLYQKN